MLPLIIDLDLGLLTDVAIGTLYIYWLDVYLDLEPDLGLVDMGKIAGSSMDLREFLTCDITSPLLLLNPPFFSSIYYIIINYLHK